jgi:hypothetical protein
MKVKDLINKLQKENPEAELEWRLVAKSEKEIAGFGALFG